MTIHGAAGLYGLLNSIGMCDRDATLRRVVNCVIDLQSGCACHNRTDKLQKKKNCNQMYTDAVKLILPNLKDELLKKVADRELIFLNDDGTIIKTISR